MTACPDLPGRLDPEVRRRLATAGQGHLVTHAEALPSPAEAEAFLAAADAEPWDAILQALRTPSRGVSPVLRPPNALTLKRQQVEGRLGERLAAAGRRLLAEGRVATLLLAGGQGSRLGFDGPKGNYVLGPDPARTLYRIQAERVAAASRSAGRPVPFVVLVSGGTAAATREAFASGAASWGLLPDQVRFVEQGQLPAVDAEGRALLVAPGRLARAPDGHGGALTALHVQGVLEDLRSRGVEFLTTFQVDNPLALPLDPVLLGWMAERGAEAGGKAVRRLPGEKVGVYARDGTGRHLVVEYSEFPEGGLPDALVMGSIALHAFSVPWLAGLFSGGLRLPYHLAWKKVAHLGPEGTLVTPSSPNAWKFEQFVFDVFPHAERVEVQEVAREREFAPVKNATGADSPETARALVATEVLRWYAARGKPPPEPPELSPLAMREIDPSAA